MNQCPFCHIQGDRDQKIIYENEFAIYTSAEKYNGALKYAGVIIPRAHKITPFDFSDEEFNATFQLLRKAKDYLEQNYQPDGYNVGWNCHEIGGQHIMHAHLHVIPRFKEEPMAGKGIRHLLKSKENEW